MGNALLAKCLGELIGSFILTFGVIMAQYTAKQKAFGLDTKLKQRGFLAAAVMALVVVAITVAFGFGKSGFINPAIAVMIAIAKSENIKDIGAIIGFELIGGLIAGMVGALTIKFIECPKKETNDTETTKEVDNQEVKENGMQKVFNLPNQSFLKTTGMEWLANIFWLLPVASLIIGLGAANSMGHVATISVFEVSLAAGFAIAFIILVIDEHGAANLNPQIWFGLLVGMVVFNFKNISKLHVINAIVSIVNIFIIAVLLGFMTKGISSLVKPTKLLESAEVKSTAKLLLTFIK